MSQEVDPRSPWERQGDVVIDVVPLMKKVARGVFEEAGVGGTEAAQPLWLTEDPAFVAERVSRLYDALVAENFASPAALQIIAAIVESGR